MKVLEDQRWRRTGMSLLWDESELSDVLGEAASMRQFLRMRGAWPPELPSKDGRALVVAGLDAFLCVLDEEQADRWLHQALFPTLSSFESSDGYGREAALVFWFPGGRSRIKSDAASDDYFLQLDSRGDRSVSLGKALWPGQVGEIHRICTPGQEAAGQAWKGLWIKSLS
jgi:hypothetical protein